MADQVPGVQRELTTDDQARIDLLAADAFTPGSPVRQRDVFAGRKNQLRQVIDAIVQRGKSVVIYGERGVGKTSLANVIKDTFLSRENSRIFAPIVSADSEDSFHSIWTKIIQEKERFGPNERLSPQSSEKIDAIVEQAAGTITPHHVRLIADVVSATHLMIPIIDEFDRVKDPYVIALFNDAIKAVSDHTNGTTIILVGVGATVEELIGEHASLIRSIEQVLMPRMTPEESHGILEKGQTLTGVRFSDDATQLIVALSQGLPDYIHLLGLNATRAAIDDKSWIVQEKHVDIAIKVAMAGRLHSLSTEHHDAVTSKHKVSIFRQVLLASALADADNLGYFSPAAVRDPLSKIMNSKFEIPRFAQNLSLLCDPDRGSVLVKSGKESRPLYRFNNPLLQPFVIMDGLERKLIGKEDIRGLFRIGRDPTGQKQLF